MRQQEGLGGLAEQAEAAVFRGRQAELKAMLAPLDEPGRLPAVVSVTGPPGIGKTTFAYALGRAWRDRGASVAIIDSRDFPHTLAGLNDAVGSACGEAWEADSGRATVPLLLVLDTFEELGDLSDQLWERFLPGLRGPVLVLLSGRSRARGGAPSSGWRLVTGEIELGPLPDDQARRLLADMGVTGNDAVAAIVDLAGGSPLLLCVAAEVHRAGGASDLAQFGIPGEAARPLIARMSRELRRPDVRDLLQAASLVRTFDEELLAAMAGPVPAEAFDALCELSVVRVTAAGARVHDIVRQTVSAELRWRAPERYSRLRRRAGEHLLARAGAGWQVVPELLHLVGETVGPRRFFAEATDRGVSLRPARDGDLPRLERVCLDGSHNFGWPAAHRLRELRADFAVAMHWFVVACADERAVAYSYSLPLHRETWAGVASARGSYFSVLPPGESAAVRQAPPGAPAAFLIAGTVALDSYGSAEPALRLATFTNRHIRAPAVRRSYVLMPQGSPFEATALSLGMSRRLAGIQMQAGEPLADEWILDYGHLGLPSWVQRSLGLTEPGSPLDLMTDEVLAAQVKLALEDLYRPASLAQSPLVRLCCARSAEGQATGLRQLLLRLLDDLSNAGRARDRQAAALLISYYVKRVGSHEVVAQRLGLPRTTFYRRLHHGLELLAARIRVTEAVNDAQCGKWY